jgi:acyl-CoA synthetase (AMP-forming)/AMP-acid ligase II
VHAETIERFIQTFAPHGFDPRAMYPAYGMAEATLLISGGHRGGGHVTRSVSRTALQAHAAERPSEAEDTQVAVGCGRALTGERIAIVNADDRTRLPADRVGEIWVNGANIARAYWRNDEATREGLNAQIAGEGGPWLRTGDLGFVDVTGELFVTGRIKDLIIIRGINHYPQDVERTVQSLDGALRENCGAAFSVQDESGEETLVIVQEIERTARHSIDTEAIKGLIREAVADHHELSARHIALIRPGALPKTTSGKIQRKLARRLWLDGGFEGIG